MEHDYPELTGLFLDSELITFDQWLSNQVLHAKMASEHGYHRLQMVQHIVNLYKECRAPIDPMRSKEQS